MAMPRGHHTTTTGVYATDSRVSRLCLRPERQPGKAPPCEDDAIQNPGDWTKRAPPVTLPKLKWLEGKS